MDRDNKVILSCAVTGSIHTPTMSSYLPVTPEEICESAVAAAEAGAAIVHLHARDPETGKPTPDPDIFMRFLPRIRERSDAVINITTGGGHGMSLDERLAAARRASPELASLNMGSFNFALFPLAEKIEQFRWDWEREHLENTRDFIFKNTFEDIERILKDLGDERGVRFEFECYDVGHLYNLAYFLDAGLVRPPLFVQTIVGVMGGIGADVENLMHMHRIAQKLFGDAFEWSILAAGRHQMRYGAIGAASGGHVRVGLEDSLYLGRGQLAESNAAQVANIKTILECLSLEAATPAEARQRLGLKGADAVAF
jgi:uncharacterized protein (DUF849 family)